MTRIACNSDEKSSEPTCLVSAEEASPEMQVMRIREKYWTGSK